MTWERTLCSECLGEGTIKYGLPRAWVFRFWETRRKVIHCVEWKRETCAACEGRGYTDD